MEQLIIARYDVFYFKILSNLIFKITLQLGFESHYENETPGPQRG